jgi:hypothetical protein
MRSDLPDAVRTRAYHQAAYVALRCADIPQARAYAERVLDVAVPNGLYDLAARGHSILYEIAHAWDFDPKRALAQLELGAAYGLKAGDTHIRQWALLGVYYIEAERGNGAMMGTIERALNAPEPSCRRRRCVRVGVVISVTRIDSWLGAPMVSSRQTGVPCAGPRSHSSRRHRDRAPMRLRPHTPPSANSRADMPGNTARKPRPIF